MPSADQGGEHQFRLLADNAPVMIWRSDTTKACDFFNKPWLEFSGRPMEQELGFGWAEAVHPEDYERCVEIYVTAFDAREKFTMPYRLRRRDGEYRWLLDNGSPYFLSAAYGRNQRRCRPGARRIDFKETVAPISEEVNHRTRARSTWPLSVICTGMR